MHFPPFVTKLTASKLYWHCAPINGTEKLHAVTEFIAITQGTSIKKRIRFIQAPQIAHLSSTQTDMLLQNLHSHTIVLYYFK